MAEKKGFWGGVKDLFSKKEKTPTGVDAAIKSTEDAKARTSEAFGDTKTVADTTLENSAKMDIQGTAENLKGMIKNQTPKIEKFGDSVDTLEDIREFSREQLMDVAENIIECGLESSYLTPDKKYKSIKDYLSQELSVNIKATHWEDLGNLDKIDELICYNQEKIWEKQKQKFIKKTTTAAGATAATATVLGIMTGGAGVFTSLAGFVGSSVGRGVVEGAKYFTDIYGKGKNIRLEMAQNFLVYGLEAQNIAIEMVENENDPERFWQAGAKMIDLLTAQQKEPKIDIIKKIVQSKEDLAKYEKKWNTTEEIVSFIGGAATAMTYGVLKGVEQLTGLKLQKIAEGAKIDLDHNGIPHALKKIGDAYHYIVESTDIAQAKAKLGEHWFQWMHQVGGEVAKVGTPHASVISEQIVKDYVVKESFKDVLTKIVPITSAGLFASSAINWAKDRSAIKTKLGINPEKEQSKELINKNYGAIINEEIAKAKQEVEKTENASEKPPQPSGLFDSAKKDEYYEIYFDNKPYRFKVESIDTKKNEVHLIDIDNCQKVKNENGQLIDERNSLGQVVFDLPKDKFNRAAKKWEFDVSSEKHGEEMEIIKDHEKLLEKVENGNIVEFISDKTRPDNLEKSKKYAIYKFDKDKNFIQIYDVKMGRLAENLIRFKLSDFLPRIKGFEKEIVAKTETKKSPYKVGDLVIFNRTNKDGKVFQNTGEITNIDKEKHTITSKSPDGTKTYTNVVDLKDIIKKA